MDIDGVYYCSKCMRRLDGEADICPHCGYDAENVQEDSRYLCEGTFLNDRYIFGAVIGSGGFGVTYAAWDTNLQAPVAIKEYFPGHLARRDAEESGEIVPNPANRAAFQIGLDRFKREAQILAQLRNIPGVVNVYESFEDNGTCYIVMEYVRGVPLDAYVQDNTPDAKTLLAMMRAPIHALEIIHKQGVHHRDITPRNMLVQEDGSVKLIDFGAAREIEHETQLVTASDGYAPIEQYDMEHQQGPWGDIYSLCATIYHMLTGVRPTSSLSRVKRDTLLPPTKLGVKLKRHQERALMMGLAVHPEKRVRSMEEFASILYNTPLPEEARRRRAFMRRVCAVMAGITAVFALIVLNFVCGFPLGKGLLYALHGDGWHVVGATQEKAEVVIPERVLFLPVSAIEPDVFAGSNVLEAVTIPGGVDTVEPYTFRGCTNLRVATLEEGVRRINNYAFSGCEQLHTVNAPKSLGRVDQHAFDGACEQLMLTYESYLSGPSLGVRNSDIDVSSYARADYAYSLVEGGAQLSYKPEWSGYMEKFVIPSYIDGIPVVEIEDSFDFSNTADHIVLPAYLRKIKESFMNMDDSFLAENEEYRETVHVINQIDLGHCLTSIPDYAFTDQYKLQRVSIPDTVETIGKAAFCSTALRTIKLPEKLKEIGDDAFADTQINEVALPDTVEIIGANAFRNTSIFSIDFPWGIRQIGEYAFSNTNIDELKYRGDLDSLGEGVFSHCDSLESVEIIAYDSDTGTDDQNMLPERCFAESAVYFAHIWGEPINVGGVGKECFIDNKDLHVVWLQGADMKIEERAFANCPELSSVEIQGTVSFIDDTAFENSPNVVLKASENGYVQEYAMKHGISFESR